MEFEGWTRDLLIFLVTAGIVVPLFSRIRLGIVLGFLLAGVLLGPGGLGALADDVEWLSYVTFSDDERVAPLAELGVLFLLFTVGLELSVGRLWAMRRLVFGAGMAQILISAVVIAIAARWFNAGPTAVIIGLGLAFSSTAIALQLLIQAKRLGSEVGRTTFGILLMQDLMVVPGVILITVLGGDSEVSEQTAILRGLGLAVGVVGGIVIVGRFVLEPLLRLAASTKSREIIVAIALLVAIGAATLTAAAGLSAALGAFLAGLLLAASEYRHQIEVDIEPFKGLLLGLFFMTVGMGVDLEVVRGELLAVIAAVAALVVVKGAIVYGVVRIFGGSHPTAVEASFLLAGAGEFAFVLFSLARGESLFVATDLDFATTVAAVSMLLTPLLAMVGQRLNSRLARVIEGEGADHAPVEVGELSNHVIIGGFGRVGEMVGTLLETMSTPYVAIDLDARRVASARSEGRPVYYGDIGRQELLERLGGDKAAGFVITSDLPIETDHTVAMIRQIWPNAKIFARAKDPAHAHRLLGIGATDVVPEATEGSLQLAAHVMQGIGLPDDIVLESIDKVRDSLLRGVGPEQS